MATYNNEEDHLVSGIPTEGADVGSFLLLGGKMLFWPDSRKGNPLGGPYVPKIETVVHRLHRILVHHTSP